VGGPSIHFHQPTFSANTINGINNTGAFDIHLLKESKKRKKDQEDEEEDEGIDNTAILYDRLIVGIETARENQTACLMTPLCWSVVDLRAENVSPCPKHPRAKEFLSDTEVQNLQQTTIEIINIESHLGPSAKTLLETLQCSTFSLRKLSKEKRARGIEGICSLLKIDAKIYDKDTQYVGECMDAFWVHIYGGTTNIERTVDMHLIGPFSKTPGWRKSFRDEKSSRSESGATGKACDFIFWRNGHEIGIGENTGSTRKDHHKKSVTDFVDVINVARSQHISFQTKCIEKSGRNPLPSNIENVLKSVPIPFFQVIGMKIRFYILIQINGDLYGMWEWSSQDLPRKDDDIITAMALCKKFLIHRNLLNRTSNLTQTAIRLSQVFRENVENTQDFHINKSVKLSPIVAPKEKRG
ncbi:11254_t:CDS:2, partial [Dentiscutata heterogama]